jgi:hypothetical protein
VVNVCIQYWLWTHRYCHRNNFITTSALAKRYSFGGDFQHRCKPGESQVSGTGQALRGAGAETAHTLSSIVGSTECGRSFPRIFPPHNIVEAFPNGFLGVSLASMVFEGVPSRVEKFDWLYDRWLGADMLTTMKKAIAWPREQFWASFAGTNNHDERAALVCALTSLCVLCGKYVAVGPLENKWADSFFSHLGSCGSLGRARLLTRIALIVV